MEESRVALPLDFYSSEGELTLAIIDAVHGHQKLAENGLLHHDVSFSNILLSAEYNHKLNRRTGFLVDLDLPTDDAEEILANETNSIDAQSPVSTSSCVSDQHTTATKANISLSNRRRGTLPFIAVDYMIAEVKHRAAHELESFFWVLLWICLNLKRCKIPREMLPVPDTMKPLDPIPPSTARLQLKLGHGPFVPWETIFRWRHEALKECERVEFIIENYDPDFWLISTSVMRLGLIIQEARLVDVPVFPPFKEPMFFDKRTHSHFLSILDDAYERIREREYYLPIPQTRRESDPIESESDSDEATTQTGSSISQREDAQSDDSSE